MRQLFTGVMRGNNTRDVVRRSTIVSLVSFLTLIDLFGSQALLPQIVDSFRTSPALAGFAVNAATLGMAISGLTVAWFADRIDRKRGIWMCLALLSIPTMFLAFTESIWIFLVLRILQGMCMAAAFTLTMTYLSERCDVMAVGGVMAAYITGNVASNLFGRLLAVSASDLVGLSGSFLVFAALNLLGAFIAFLLIGSSDSNPPSGTRNPVAAWKAHWSDPAMRAIFVIGFLILMVFVGLFTFVNLHLVDALGVRPLLLGFVYLTFIPAIFSTPYAGLLAKRLGSRNTLAASLTVTFLAIALTLLPSLQAVLCALALVGMAIFFAQAAATGFISQHVVKDQAAANGLYLSSYYAGGLVGALVFGQIYASYAWLGVVTGLAIATAFSVVLTIYLKD